MQSRSSGSVKIFYPPFNREGLLTLLRQRIVKLQEKLPLKRVVLFGSYAQGRQTIASDIDLLVIYAGQPCEDAYALVKRTLNIRRLEPHVYAEEEYEQVKMTVERMARDGVRVF
jgi:predicted nucleotidyltransferase